MSDAVRHGEGSNVFFRELQYFRQWWLWLIVLFIAGLSWHAAVEQLILGIPAGNNPASDPEVLVIWVVFGILFPALFWFSRLITEVRSDGLYICFFPFHLSFKKIPFTQIKKYEARTYSPIGDYGGWGIRYGFEGKAYNVTGNRGVQLEFVDGKRLLVGSQRPEEFVAAIDAALGKKRGAGDLPHARMRRIRNKNREN